MECKSYKWIEHALESYTFKPGERDLISYDKSHYFDFLGNPILFLRIIFNLLSNSLYQIHQKGKGAIYISSESTATAHLIRFRDTAGGAAPEVINHLFDAYKTIKKEGTGVGLAFCKLTMQSFGGDITCHCAEGNYIEFILTFPKIKK